MAYINITAEEMRNFLQAAKGWTEFDSQTGEYIYICQVAFMPLGTVLKVYTGISKRNGASRSKGKDAIRVCVVDGNGHGKGIISTSHVKRVVGWKQNLIARIVETLKELKRLKRPSQPAPAPDYDADCMDGEDFDAMYERHLDQRSQERGWQD